MKQTVIIITGAASGIGEALSHQAAQRGHSLALWDVNQDKLNALQQELAAKHSIRTSTHTCDISDPIQVDQATQDTLAQHQNIDVLINNAGIAHIGNIEKTKGDDLDKLYAVNVKGVYHCIHAIIPHMREKRSGTILNLASIASKVGIKDRFAYSMTKGAVLSMTLSVARDYVEHGIRCNCICPARVHTPFVDNFLQQNYPGEEESMMEALSQYQPIGRMGQPHEIAKLALFLCSEDASFITGSAYDIDGGVTLLR